MITAVSRLKEYLNRCKQYKISAAYYEENLQAQNELREEIRTQIRGGRIEDRATRERFSVRTEITRTEDKIKEKAEVVLRSNKEAMSDNFCTLRNGRICVPVKKEYKFRVSGSVIDKSSTGNTLFIEPIGVSRLFEELQILKIEEENEERRILYTLTAKIADYAEEMRQNLRTIEKLDFIFSKGGRCGATDQHGTQDCVKGRSSSADGKSEMYSAAVPDWKRRTGYSDYRTEHRR